MLVKSEHWALFFSSATADRTAIINAMRQLENYVAMNNVRCVQFRPKQANDIYFIQIVSGSGCSSYVSSFPHSRSSCIQ